MDDTIPTGEGYVTLSETEYKELQAGLARVTAERDAYKNEARDVKFANDTLNDERQALRARVAELKREALDRVAHINKLEFALAFEKEQALARSEAATPAKHPDTERLDWMIAYSAFLSHSRDGEVCNVWFSQDPDDDSNGAVPAQGYPQKCYGDAREAIDAARKQGGAHE